MRTSHRRGLSALAALALVLGSALVATPAHADPADPVVDITSPAADAIIGGSGFTYSVTVTDPDDDLKQWLSSASGPEPHGPWGHADPSVPWFPSPDNFSQFVDTTSWTNGVYTIGAVAKDALNHEGYDQVTFTVTNGLEPNRFTAPGEWSYHNGDVQFTGRLASVGDYASYSVDGGSRTLVPTDYTDVAWAQWFDFTVPASELPEGDRTVSIFRDSSDSVPVLTRSIHIDRTPPVISAAPNFFKAPGTNPITFQATIGDASPVTYTLGNGGPGANWTAIDYEATYGGMITADIDTSVIDLTDRYFSLYAVDAAGNSSYVERAYGFDGDNPTVSISSPSANELVSGTFDLLFTAGDAPSGIQSVDLDAHGVTAAGVCKVPSLRDWDPVLVSGDALEGEYSSSIDTTTGPDGKFCLRAVVSDYINHSATTSVIVIVDNTKPTKPAPADTSGDWESFSDLEWSDSTDANGIEGYEYVVRDGDGDLVEKGETTDSNVALANPLTYPDEYVWRVRALDNAGNYSLWSAWTTIDVYGIPEITDPCGCSVVSDSIYVAWTPVDLPSWADSFVYRVRFTEVETGDKFSFTVPSTETWYGHNIPASYPDGEWLIEVQAVYTYGVLEQAGTFSEAVTVFRDSVAPDMPELYAPDDGDGFVDDSFTFTWEDVDAELYEFRWATTDDTNDNGRLTPSNFYLTLDPELDADELGLSEGVYWWQVRAWDLAGNHSAWAEPQQFFIDTLAPAKATLLAPGDGSSGAVDDVTFSWEPPAPAPDEFSRIQVSTSPTTGGDGSFTTTLGTWSLSDSAFVIEDFPNGTYYWHVRTFDSADNLGDWSDTWSFVIAKPAPPAPPKATTTGSSSGSAIPGSTPTPTPEPTAEPTAKPSAEPSDEPTEEPTDTPTDEPDASDGGDSGFPVWIIIGLVIIVLAGGGFLIRFLVLRRP
jgi:hypothetical protein